MAVNIIKIVGIGSSGCAVVNHMIQAGLEDLAEFISIEMDNQTLMKCTVRQKILIGENQTRGLGQLSHEAAAVAARNEREKIVYALRGADIVFLVAGMGGEVGTGAAPVISRIAKDLGALTIAVVSEPFEFEGKRRKLRAEIGISELKKNSDGLVVVPLDGILANAHKDTTLSCAFEMADGVLSQRLKILIAALQGEE